MSSSDAAAAAAASAAAAGGGGGAGDGVNELTVVWSTHEEAMRTGEFTVWVRSGTHVVGGPWRFAFDDAARFFDDYVAMIGGRMLGVVSAVHETQAAAAMEARLDKLAEDREVDEVIGSDSAWLKWFNSGEL